MSLKGKGVLDPDMVEMESLRLKNIVPSMSYIIFKYEKYILLQHMGF